MQLLWKLFKRNHFEANIDECGIEIGTPNVSYQYTVVKPAVLHIIVAGTGSFTYQQSTYQLKSGDMFLLQEGMHVHYEASADDPWTYHWVGFSGNLAIDYLKRTSLIDCPVVMNKDTSDISKVMYQICERAITYETATSDDIHHLSDLYKLLFLITQCAPKPFEKEHNEIYSSVQDAVDYMNQNYMYAITIDDIAQYAKVSRSYLYKLFIKWMDQSPQQYLIYLRLYHASSMLKTTSKPIQDIAQAVGYSDPLLFSKAFRKHFDMPPSTYRKVYK
ncbi:AraC family transcriptional regulator [Staphylococcus hyicus]|uniref:AraC family transcriptional regulator n=1 Tax=Staphylococcus hyicus TaxID=1284 RepID=A0A2T4R7G1_STAHY|nr:AraC family transcriptional regulator [Staphylococcus hyicus]MCO4328841.1 AraC family transcriptional regulator [Staphylococcus hyicus]MCO4331026.1 AraC family transcriptional regulator [Staphylococcus hyicus]MCO4333323.1 AraC family transcriptional regulator [Staphylococcus hyicus]MCO4336903.1 AraC family transcriptional regulator [Staphylococcus hyicus]MDP4468955.1 AraC family transcriptional regulator [Staphylococcus hyicus]